RGGLRAELVPRRVRGGVGDGLAVLFGGRAESRRLGGVEDERRIELVAERRPGHRERERPRRPGLVTEELVHARDGRADADARDARVALSAGVAVVTSRAIRVGGGASTCCFVARFGAVAVAIGARARRAGVHRAAARLALVGTVAEDPIAARGAIHRGPAHRWLAAARAAGLHLTLGAAAVTGHTVAVVPLLAGAAEPVAPE